MIAISATLLVLTIFWNSLYGSGSVERICTQMSQGEYREHRKDEVPDAELEFSFSIAFYRSVSALLDGALARVDQGTSPSGSPGITRGRRRKYAASIGEN